MTDSSAPLPTPPTHYNTPRYGLVALVALTTVLLDQLSKGWILSTFTPGDIKPVIPGLFNLTLTFNPGAAFGLWTGLSDGWRQLLLSLTVLIALAVVLFFLRQPTHRGRLSQIALAAILGGAIGNIIDRLRLGSVVDFIDIYLGSWHWPAFNIADSAICVGVAILILLPQSKTTPKNA